MKWKAVKIAGSPEKPSYKIDIETEELASDIEERMYRAFLNNDVNDEDIEFQPSYVAGRNLPGEVRPDFTLTGYGLLMIWYADGEYFHKTAAQRGKDEINDARLMKTLEGEALPPIRIPGEYLQEQDMADETIGEYL